MTKMDNSVKITLIVVLGVLVLGILGYALIGSFNPVNSETLSVSGSATLTAIPDLVSVYFNVETKGQTTQEAKDANSEIIDKMITDLIKLGLERKDIVTENYNIYEDCEWRSSGRVCNGFKASYSIRIKLSTDNMDKVGNVIDAGVNAGAKLSYINFELSPEKQSQYKAEAMKLAAQDAKLKAEAIAQGLDKKITKLVSVNVSDWGYYPWRAYSMDADISVAEAKQEITSIQPGEREISSSVNVVYKYK